MNEHRYGFTLVELLVAILIIGLLLALLLPALQVARESGRRTACTDNLRHIGFALQHHQTAKLAFPPGVSSNVQYPKQAWLSWCARLLPYLERSDLWETARQDYQRQPDPFKPVPHSLLGLSVPIYGCPSDDRMRTAQVTHKGYTVGLTSYLGVAGTDFESRDGVLFRDSRVNPSDIKDGLGHTILVGERPPSDDAWFGWWYAGVGQQGSGVPDMLLGVRERNIGYGELAGCPPGPYSFGRGEGQICDTLHFWSHHPGGAHFAFADTSVRFLRYTDVLERLATRARRD
jgi:prepilin-type N-terminal cleavage/methylation domain-containing protein/prepilin-type processing-associated H-X9-DG protein